jgi:hypothetical protein
MSKYIFRPENIEIDRPKVFEVPRGGEVIIDHFHFMENQISRIEVKKIEDCQDTIFINLYSGNIRIGHVVAKNEDYVLDIDTIGNALRYYDIRLSTELDEEE